jgi:hypothetical protein
VLFADRRKNGYWHCKVVLINKRLMGSFQLTKVAGGGREQFPAPIRPGTAHSLASALPKKAKSSKSYTRIYRYLVGLCAYRKSNPAVMVVQSTGH